MAWGNTECAENPWGRIAGWDRFLRARLAFHSRASGDRSALWPRRSEEEFRRRATAYRLRMFRAPPAFPTRRINRAGGRGLGRELPTTTARSGRTLAFSFGVIDGLVSKVQLAAIGEDDLGAGISRPRVGDG